MSFWLSASSAQNCSLNLKIVDLKESARSQVSPTVQTNAGSDDTRTHRTLPARPSGLWRRGTKLFKKNLTLKAR
jgi:hypothetical protein